MIDRIIVGVFASAGWADEEVISEKIEAFKGELKGHSTDEVKYSFGSIITDGSEDLSIVLLNICRNKGIAFGCFCPNYYPDGVKHFKGAKMKESYRTIRKSDYILFFWDGESKGTKFLIDHAKKEGKRFEIVEIENPRSKFVFFYGKNDIFSNFHPAPFKDSSKEIEFQNVEQGFTYYKALFFKDEKSQEYILNNGENPGACKARGRRVKNYDEAAWSEKREKVMFYLNKLKFSQNEELKQELLDTGDKIIAEASSKDLIWGTGLCSSHEDAINSEKWPGENRLGKILMNLRGKFNGLQ